MQRWVKAFVSRGLVLVAAATLTACNTLPVIVPDMAPTGAVRVEAAGGRVLSVAQSKALLDKKLGVGRAESSALERHLALEQELSSTPLTAGNAAVLLEDGPATYAAMFAAIERARDHINLETYILEADEIGAKFATALLAKQRQGVQVNLIYDSVGALSTPAEYFDRLRQAGVRVLEFNPVNPLEAKAGWDVNNRDHRKLLVVDGEIAFIGGINISAVYSSGSAGRGRSGGSGSKPKSAKDLPWRDTHIQVSGPVVSTLQRFFLDTWERQRAEPLPARNYFPPLQPRGPEVIRAIASTPDDPFSQIYATFVSAINSAESEILLTNAYFVPDPQLKEALIGAAQRGVDVRIIVPSATDSSLVFHAGRAHYADLLRGGVKLYERRNVLLHSKTAVIDGVWSTVGSTNLDWRSFLHNQEVNVVVLGAGFAERMKASFARDLAASDEITRDAWRHRGLDVRAKEFFARMWEYWL